MGLDQTTSFRDAIGNLLLSDVSLWPAFVFTTAAVLYGCASTPETNPRLQQLQDRLAQLQTPEASNLAPVEMQQTIDSLEQTRNMVHSGKAQTMVEHRLYLTERQLDILEQTLRHKQAQQVVDNAELRRKKLLLEARTLEAERAKKSARQMQKDALTAQDFAFQLQQELGKLKDKVRDLQARETGRGLILTLGNILFEFDSAKLRADARQTLQDIASFLNRYPPA